MKKLTQKVLLIGWDAADWKVITPLLDAGKMPNLQRLVENGVMGNLSTLYPILSPMLWTTIATGKRAHKHGIHGFSEPDPASGGARPVTNLGRSSKAIWNIAHQNGLKSNVIGWWPSHPAEPINGVMVSDHFQDVTAEYGKPWPMKPGLVHPPELADKLAPYRVHPEELTGEQLLPFVPRAAEIDQKEDKRLYSIAKVLAENASIHAAATACMQLEPWDFMGVYFDGIDHLCHGFMQYHPPQLPWVKDEDYEMYKDVVTAAYRFHDMMLGAYMELAPPDTTIMICSDHGFHSDHLRPRDIPNEPAGPADEHRHFGMFAAMGPGIKKDQLVFGASLLDITPTILTLLGLPLGKDMDGRPLMDALTTDAVPEYIESWEQVEGDAGTHPADMQIDPVDSREALKQLVELGYIDGIDEDQDKVAENTVKELRYNLARDLIDSQKHSQAIPLLEDLWEANQDESRFGLKLFECHLQLGDIDVAESTLALMRERKVTYAQQARDTLTSLEERINKMQEDGEELDDNIRRRHLKLSKQASTNDSTFAYLSGRLRHAQGRHGEALIEFEKAQQVQMHNRPSLWQQMGEVLLSMRRTQDAEQLFQKILKADPINAAAYFGLTRCYLGRRDGAEQALETANASLGMIFQNPRGHYLRAVALQRLGRLSEAVAALQTAVGQNPVYPAAQRRLGRLHMILNDSDLARHHFSLARAALKRLRQIQAGLIEQPGPADSELKPLMASVALGELGEPKQLPPLSDNTITIVSGLPRSGTSMMMQMLKAGGLTLLTDNQRQADTDNPNGYFEFESAKTPGAEALWIEQAEGKVVKIIAQLLPNLSANRDYRIVFMQRPLNEVISSQNLMLERSGKQGSALSDQRLARAYHQQTRKVRSILAAHPERVSTLAVDYHQALAAPSEVSSLLNDFFGSILDEQAMAQAIDPTLRRQGTS